jgi:phenylalanyl-tRNA synthetase beta chain
MVWWWRASSRRKHPEADRLQVCQVDAGGGELLQIVCGAPNARAGLVAPLATVGTTFGGIAIKAAKLRGVESFGMLCSAKELGIDADASRPAGTADDAPVGAPLASTSGLPDASIEIKLTPNRADCFSVRGIAFDVAAALAVRSGAVADRAGAAQSDAVLGVELEAGAKVPRFVGRVIDGRRFALRRRRCGWPSACAAAACARSASWWMSPST